MAKNDNLTDFLTGVADAIRTKKGTTAKINPQNFESEIASISTAKEEETKTISLRDVDFSSGVTIMGNKGEEEFIPTSGKVISKIVLKAPSMLMPEYIMEGTKIMGVIGTYEGNLPQLNPPVLTISETTFKVAHNPKNGEFKGNIYLSINGEKTNKTYPSGANIPMSFLDGEVNESGTYQFAFYDEGEEHFKPSELTEAITREVTKEATT